MLIYSPTFVLVKLPTHTGSGRNKFLTEVEQYLVYVMKFRVFSGCYFVRYGVINMVQGYIKSLKKNKHLPKVCKKP